MLTLLWQVNTGVGILKLCWCGLCVLQHLRWVKSGYVPQRGKRRVVAGRSGHRSAALTHVPLANARGVMRMRMVRVVREKRTWVMREVWQRGRAGNQVTG